MQAVYGGCGTGAPLGVTRGPFLSFDMGHGFESEKPPGSAGPTKPSR